MIRRARQNSRGGFTLIEVLATLVLLGIVLPVAMRGVSLALAAASSAQHMSEAATLAETKLNQLLQEQGGAAVSGTSGDFGADHPGYQWSCLSTDRDYGVTEFILRVTWIERGQERAMNISTMSAQTDTGAIASQ